MESLHRPLSQTSAQLSDVLNPSGDHRDSAYFSQNGDHSKHTSTASCNTGNLFTPSPYQNTLLDKTPSPVASTAAHPMISPTSSMSVASMVSPTTSTSVDQSMLRKLDRPSEQTLTNLNSGESLSRRGSVDSRINHDFRDMRLASSPYASQNQSTTSIQNSLNAQRNPGNGTEQRLSTISRNSNSYQPSIARGFGVEPPKQVRTAPTITGPATGSIAHAAEPTKGQAWAFPDEPIQKTTSRSNLNIDHESINQTSFLVDSRRSSLADSLASSSRYTDNSQLPYGQRRLEDGMPDYQRLSRASSEFHGASHHHHSLQSRAVSDLRDDEGGSPGSTTPYSRTPELRVSHKLAERKRRTEMKHLFEDLRDLMPQERGAKASKWEILTKAIEMHHEQRHHITQLSEVCRRANGDLELSRREAISLREENARLRDELSLVTHGQQAGGPPPQQQSSMSSQQTSQFPAYPPQGPHPPRTELPPLRNLGANSSNGGVNAQSSDSMTGVQYHHDVQRVNSYSGGRF